MAVPKHSFHQVHLNSACRSDIAWWSLFLKDWNGISFFPTFPMGHQTVLSDASGKWGCGAFTKRALHWFQVQWPEGWENMNIAIKELIPIVIGANIWGEAWARTSVKFMSDNMADNMAVEQALSSSKAPKDSYMADLVRCLFFFEACYSFVQNACHIPGKENQWADALSRGNNSTIFSLFPKTHPVPEVVPGALQSLLFNPKLNWTSKAWKGLFLDTLAKVSQQPLPQPT